jgi:predicted dienelactone hydrolase
MVEMVDPARGDRTLTVDIWYPAARRSHAETATLDLTLADLAIAEVELPGVLAEPAPARGSFPLVVFSHGHGGVRFQSWFLMRALASHGFVVAAPDHAGDARYARYLSTRAADRLDLPVDLFVRPRHARAPGVTAA